LASAATALALWRIAAVAAGPRAGWAAFALWTVAFLPAALGGAAMADATATALAAGAFAALAWPSARATFAAAALMALPIGTRASYWPLGLTLALLVAERRRAHDGPAVLGALAGTVAWALPFVAVVGVGPLWTLGTTHVAGHFTTWGGSVVTRPNLAAR